MMLTKNDYIVNINERIITYKQNFINGAPFITEDDIKNIEKIFAESIELIETYEKKEFPDNINNELLQNIFLSIELRNILIRLIGYVPLDKMFLNSLAEFIGGKKCLEVLAGKGSLAKGLKDNGVDIIATDNYSWNNTLDMSDTWTSVEKIDCLDAIIKYGKDVDYIICSWIPMGDIGYKILKTMNDVNPECKMIVIGEDDGGCTANSKFFNHIMEVPDTYHIVNKHFKSWSGIYDNIKIVTYLD